MTVLTPEPALLDRQVQAFRRVLDSGCYTLGEEARRFEQQWASRCGTAEAVGVANGMDAIEIGLRALDIGPGDEVITTAMTAFATVLAIARSGATPVLADINEETALVCPESVQRSITPRTKALLLVHLYGRIECMEPWQSLCKENGIYLLEDCAQAHLARWGTGVAGSFGKFGAYSFYPTKNLGALGDAGAIVTNDRSLADRAKVIRNYGQTERYHHVEFGLNSRLDELQAALLTERLPWLDAWTARRQEIAQRYYTQIVNPRIRLLVRNENRNSHVHHLFVVRCRERDRLAAHLKNAGIASDRHYPAALHDQPACRNILRDSHGLKRAVAHAEQCLSIPCHPMLSDDDVDRITTAINAFA